LTINTMVAIRMIHTQFHEMEVASTRNRFTSTQRELTDMMSRNAMMKLINHTADNMIQILPLFLLGTVFVMSLSFLF